MNPTDFSEPLHVVQIKAQLEDEDRARLRIKVRYWLAILCICVGVLFVFGADPLAIILAKGGGDIWSPREAEHLASIIRTIGAMLFAVGLVERVLLGCERIILLLNREARNPRA